MTNLGSLLQLAGVFSSICGFVVIFFIMVVFISVRRMGGNLERQHIYVMSTVAALFFLGAAVLTTLGANV